MNDNVKVIGVYNIDDNNDAHLIELEINEKPSLIDIGMFTQEVINVPEDEWQVAYDEHYLNSTGEKIIGDYLNLPQNNMAPTRLAFIFYQFFFTAAISIRRD